MQGLVTIKEFASMAGVLPKDIHKDSGRGKLIKCKDSEGKPRIDLGDELNQYYLAVKGSDISTTNTEEIKSKTKDNAKTTTKKTTTKRKSTQKASKIQKDVNKSDNRRADNNQPRRAEKPNELIQADIYKKSLDARKIELEIKNNEIKQERLLGNLLPRDQVLEAESIIINEVITHMNIGWDEFIEDIAIKYAMERADIIAIKKQKLEKVNSSIDKAKESSANRFAQIIQESKNLKYNV